VCTVVRITHKNLLRHSWNIQYIGLTFRKFLYNLACNKCTTKVYSVIFLKLKKYNRAPEQKTNFLSIKLVLITCLTLPKLAYLSLLYNFALRRLFFWEQSFSMIQFGEDEKWSACQKKFPPSSLSSLPYGATFILVLIIKCILSQYSGATVWHSGEPYPYHRGVILFRCFSVQRCSPIVQVHLFSFLSCTLSVFRYNNLL
jgi:hypothetical protein